MGTDVHAIFQKLDKSMEPPKWVEVDSTWEQDRHYALFAALANVRNGYGVAGDAGTAIPPIAYPRGLPEDMTIGSYDEYRFGDHSQSWLSAEEILEWYDNGINTRNRVGVVTREWYETHDKYICPDDYNTWMSDPKVIIVTTPVYDALKNVLSTLNSGSNTEAEVEMLIRDQLPAEINKRLNQQTLPRFGTTLPEVVIKLFNSITHVQVEWIENFKEELKYFFDEVRRLKEEHGEVRLVFGFDS